MTVAATLATARRIQAEYDAAVRERDRPRMRRAARALRALLAGFWAALA